jgi:hypothetical protein
MEYRSAGFGGWNGTIVGEGMSVEAPTAVLNSQTNSGSVSASSTTL